MIAAVGKAHHHHRRRPTTLQQCHLIASAALDIRSIPVENANRIVRVTYRSTCSTYGPLWLPPEAGNLELSKITTIKGDGYFLKQPTTAVDCPVADRLLSSSVGECSYCAQYS